jgi:hypothetical protein
LVGKQFGHRICAWIDQVLSNDAKTFGDTPELRDELIGCLDFMISAGVTQAHELEMRITRSDESPCGLIIANVGGLTLRLLAWGGTSTLNNPRSIMAARFGHPWLRTPEARKRP